ncbi:hypothetical protein BG015_004442 [Linnemannia schmuckeri]|uniref:Uncharacterized protein n=1 Tax=Linnemannia schmuckeri TaxID=64567 RepID=A0A9P5S929_9FUNG|nr:hypothetical protein BG015_004442 [Linnemannia schmuckeri]
MLVNAASQSHFKFDRFAPLPMVGRKSPTTYHRRTVSCLAVASYHEHYNHPAYLASGGNNQLYDTIIPEGSASPVHHQTRHVQRKSEGAISLDQLQKGLSGAGVSNVKTSAAEVKDSEDGNFTTVNVSSGSLSGKVIKLNVASPASTPRRSLLSDLLNNQAAPTRLEQNANRRRMLKSMRRYSVDASEMDFSLGGRPSSRGSPLTTISSEGENALLVDSHQGFNATPTVRYLRNPCHAAVKTKLMPSAYRGSLVRRSSKGTGEDEETPDYFASEDRVW